MNFGVNSADQICVWSNCESRIDSWLRNCKQVLCRGRNRHENSYLPIPSCPMFHSVLISWSVKASDRFGLFPFRLQQAFLTSPNRSWVAKSWVRLNIVLIIQMIKVSPDWRMDASKTVRFIVIAVCLLKCHEKSGDVRVQADRIVCLKPHISALSFKLLF